VLTTGKTHHSPPVITLKVSREATIIPCSKSRANQHFPSNCSVVTVVDVDFLIANAVQALDLQAC